MPPAGNMIRSLPARDGGRRQVQAFGKSARPPAKFDDFGSGFHENGHYGKRKANASAITSIVIDRFFGEAQNRAMLTKTELLERVETAAGSRAEIARVLNLAPARVTEMMKGARDLSFEEARTLINHYAIDGQSPSPLEALRGQGIVFVEEVDLSLGMGGGKYVEFVESKGVVPFKEDWLKGLTRGDVASLRVVRGEGDSMQPTILDGDIVLIDMAQSNINSQDRIWAIFWGDLGMIKRVRRTPGGKFMLSSDNPNISPIEAVDDEMHVLGRVVWIGRRM